MTNPLKVEDLRKSYHDGERELKVLQGVSFSVAEGEAIAVVGMSGAGKSTLLHLLGGLDRPDAGRVLFNGKDVAKLSRAQMDEYRSRSVGFVFQFHHLLPEFTAFENVLMPALIARESRSKAEPRAREILKDLGLAERQTHRPAKLSGGEQQRVALARALMNGPALLLADEPTGNLDVGTGERVIEALWKATVKKGRSLVIVTHELEIARRADRVFVLDRGKLDPLNHEDVSKRIRQMEIERKEEESANA